ncbi:MAG: succinate dehydrogenase assembly factor 2 [Magnetococcales bacterium]|nr:succinate dehydrogenase assembly factor 2 [Magnetococcales bacterium]
MENSEILRKRLILLAERRSMAEMERILGRLLASRLSGWDDEVCQRVIALLHHSDLDLLDWLAGLKKPEEGVDREVLGWLAEASTGAHSV